MALCTNGLSDGFVWSMYRIKSCTSCESINMSLWSLAYAEDIALIANKEEELKAMMKRVEHFLDRRKLNLNVESPRQWSSKREEEKKKHELELEK